MARMHTKPNAEHVAEFISQCSLVRVKELQLCCQMSADGLRWLRYVCEAKPSRECGCGGHKVSYDA